MNKPVVSEGVATLQGQQAQGTSKFGREIDEEANGYFQRIYGNPDNGNSNYLPVDEVLSSKNIVSHQRNLVFYWLLFHAAER